jgi:hypothetical protein
LVGDDVKNDWIDDAGMVLVRSRGAIVEVVK